MMIILEDEQVEEVRDILGSMFIKHRKSEETLRLSQWLDEVVSIQTKERNDLYVKAIN